MCLTDAEYVRLSLNGHSEAFAELVRHHQIPLVKYLSARLGNEEEAAEAAQETVVRAFSTLRKLRQPDSFRSWLLGIADRVAKEIQRKRRRGKQPIPLPCEPTTDDPNIYRDHALDQAVAELPAIYRQVVLLRFYGGLSCAEVSRDLGVPVGTVTMRLSRAYRLLREQLTEED